MARFDGVCWIYFGRLGLLCAVLLIASPWASAATRKHVDMPSRSSVVNSTGASFQTPSGEAAFHGQDKVDYHTAGNRFNTGDNPGGKQKVVVKPAVKASPKSVGKAAVSGLRRGIPGAVIGAATQAILNAVDAVIDQDGAVRVPSVTVDGEPVDQVIQGSNPSFTACSLPASQTMGKTIIRKYGVDTFAHTVLPASSPTPSGYQINNNCIDRQNGYHSDPITARFPVEYRKLLSSTAIDYGTRSPSDADWTKMEAFASAQNSSFVRDLLKESCAGSLNPAACIEGLTSWHDLSGPPSQFGPESTTTKSVTGPDGVVSTVSTTTQNKYDYKFGPTYYDYSTTTTTTVNTPTGSTITVTSDDDVVTNDEGENSSDEPLLCSGDICEGPGYVELYTKTDKTKESELATFSSRAANIPIIKAVSGLFDVSVSGSCPTWRYTGAANIIGHSMSIDLVFDHMCLPWFTSYGPWIRAVIYLVCVALAIRIALL